MANLEHLAKLAEGVEVWNQWREENPDSRPDLRRADLSGSDLSDTNLSGVDLSGVDLSYADLSDANLSDAVLDRANFKGADLSRVKLIGVDLFDVDFSDAKLSDVDLGEIVDPSQIQAYSINFNGTNLIGINLSDPEIDLDIDLSYADLSNVDFYRKDLRDLGLHGAKLIGAELVEANLNGNDLRKADLSYANLRQTQVLGTNFANAIFTGACIEDWNINSATKFDGAICEYVYLKAGQKERRPREGKFKPGEFAALFQQAVDTVDLIFIDGLDWQSFFASFQELRQQYDDAEINIQAIEKKTCGAFVVRLEVSESLDKAILQQSWNDIYEENQQLQAQLLKTEGKLEGYKEQLDDFQQKVLKGMNAPKYDLSHAQFSGGFIETNQGSQYGGTINNYGASLDDITRLITALRGQAQTFPAEHKDEALDVLKDLERDIQDPEPDTNRIGRRLKGLAAIATTVGALAGGAATFSGNLNTFTGNVMELTETLGIPVEQVQPSQLP